MTALDVRLESSEWIGAWKPEAGRLTVSTTAAPRLRDRVAVRVQLVTPSVRATVIGRVVSSERQETQTRIQVAVEAESLDAARLLLSAAKGEPVTFRDRPPRYLVKLPVLTTRGGANFYLTTLSVSSSGCSLRWPGSLPTLGEAVMLRFTATRSVDMRGVVRWRKQASSTVGISFLGQSAASDAWRTLVEGVKKSGAPPT